VSEHTTPHMRFARVIVDRPSRFAKQLATHMGHKATVTSTENGWDMFFDPSRATLTASDSATPAHLDIRVTSPTVEGIDSVTAALERHLTTFTARQGGVTISWLEGVESENTQE
jgi:hypothetical protein